MSNEYVYCIYIYNVVILKSCFLPLPASLYGINESVRYMYSADCVFLYLLKLSESVKIFWNFLGVLHPVAMDRATSPATTRRIEAFPGVHDWTSHAGHCLKNLERDKNHSSMKAFEMIQ